MLEHLLGLYYPSIQIKNDSWLKIAALYWDKIGRIAPVGYPHDDYDVVKQLIEEADFIRDLEPSSEELEATAELFLALLQKYGRQMKSRYGLAPNNKTTLLNYPQRFSNVADRIYYDKRRGQEPRLTFIASAGKMAPKLKQAFLQKGLAQYIGLTEELNAFEFVEMHPQLAFPYMEALAEQMAFSRKIHPITDDIFHHYTISHYTVERLADILLKSTKAHSTTISPTEKSIKLCVANITIQSILPKNPTNIPINKIIRFRDKYRVELTRFQIYLNKFVSNLSSMQDIKDYATLNMYLTAEYEKNLKPQIDDLRKCLNSLSIDTITGVLNVRAVQPELITSLEGYMPIMPANPVLTGIGAAGAVIFSILPVARKQRAAAKNLVDDAPVAYLLHMQEELKPSTVNQHLSQLARRSVLGI